MMRFLVSVCLLFLAQMCQAQPVLVSQETHDRYMRFVPAGIFSEDEKARMVFYDRDVVPSHFQHDGGFFLTSNNFSADRREPFGNPNRELPWITGGLDNSDNAFDFKALILPAGRHITARPGRVPLQEPQLEHGAPWVAECPVGTKACEFLVLRRGEYGYTFEARVLEKVRAGSFHDAPSNLKVHWYRPFRDREDFLRLVKGTPYAKQLCEPVLREETIRDDHFLYSIGIGNQQRSVLNVRAPVEMLPDIEDKATLAKVFRRRFVEATDRPWLTTEDNATYAARGGPFPHAFQGTHFNSTQCLKCHSTTLKHEADFQARDWYGFVRGTKDGLFSVPIADPACCRGGRNAAVLRPFLDRRMVAAGLLRQD